MCGKDANRDVSQRWGTIWPVWSSSFESGQLRCETRLWTRSYWKTCMIQGRKSLVSQLLHSHPFRSDIIHRKAEECACPPTTGFEQTRPMFELVLPKTLGIQAEIETSSCTATPYPRLAVLCLLVTDASAFRSASSCLNFSTTIFRVSCW